MPNSRHQQQQGGGDYEGAQSGSTAPRGLLTMEKVAASLSTLGHTPDGELVYLQAQLKGLGLYNIDLLGQKFVNLQSINLDRNKITSLEGLKGMKHLVVLSAAFNNITARGITALIGVGRSDDEGYAGPSPDSTSYCPLRRSLQRVILHHNKIEDASCVRGFEYAYEIDLSHNNIQGDIDDKCFSHMSSLGSLNVSHNRIQSVDEWAFEGCHALQHLDMGHNEISKFNFVSFVSSSLKTLRIPYNTVIACEPLSCLKKLTDLDLSSNNIYDLGEVANLAGCTALRVLDLAGNPAVNETSTAGVISGRADGFGAGGAGTSAVASLSTTNKRIGAGAGGRGLAADGSNNTANADTLGLLDDDNDEEHEGAATDEVEDERLRHRMANFQVDVNIGGGPLSSSSSRARNNGGGGDTKASRNLASLAARKQQQQQHQRGVGGAQNNNNNTNYNSNAPREVVATPFSEMYLHLSRQKELNMNVANVIRRTAQLLKTCQEHDVAAGRLGSSMQFDQTGNQHQQQQTVSAASAHHTSDTNKFIGSLGGQSGASTMLLSPEEEDNLELQQLSPEQQIRLKILWRLSGVAVLDGIEVSAEELALAQCLAGGTDRKQRQEAKNRAFGTGHQSYNANAAPTHQSETSHYGGRSNTTVAVGGASNAIHSLRHQQ